MKQLLFIGILLIAFLAGCAQSNENHTGNLQPSVMEEGSSAEQTLDPQAQLQPVSSPAEAQEDPPFDKGIFVDFSKLNADFITDEIVQKLRDNLEAVINRDEDKFRASLLEGHDTIGNMDYVLGINQYKFLDIGETSYNEKTKIIMIGVYAEILREKQINKGAIDYYFQQDQTGEWKIALID